MNRPGEDLWPLQSPGKATGNNEAEGQIKEKSNTMVIYRTEPPEFNRYLDVIEEIDLGEQPAEFREPEFGDFAASEYSHRYDRLRALMALENVGAVIASQEENVRYFTGYRSVLWVSRFRPYFAIMTRQTADPATLLLPPQERGNAEATSWVREPNFYPAQERPIPYLVSVLKERGLESARIGIELGFGQRLGMNQEQFDELVGLLPAAEFVDATPLMQAVRMLKSEKEIELIGKACEISEEGARAGWNVLKAGMTEKELVAVMTSRMYERGAEVGTKPSLFACMAGDRWHMSNSFATDNVIHAGDKVMIDVGAVSGGYFCDFIRHASLGELTEDDKRYFDSAIKANQAAISKIRPGVHCSEVYDAALASFERDGVKDHNRHNIIGHGLGLDVHEVPWVGEKAKVYTSDVALRQGMVLCIEPGLVPPSGDGVPGHHVVEEVVAVTRDGSRLLTSHLSPQVWVVDL